MKQLTNPLMVWPLQFPSRGPDLSTDDGAEKFISEGHAPEVAASLVGIYHCARGPVANGGHGLGIVEAIDYTLTKYLAIIKEAQG